MVTPLFRKKSRGVVGVPTRPWMSPDSRTLMSLFKGPKQVMSLVIFGLCWSQCSEAPPVLLYIFMIDATYLYHKDFDSPLVSPYSYVPFDPAGYQS